MSADATVCRYLRSRMADGWLVATSLWQIQMASGRVNMAQDV